MRRILIVAVVAFVAGRALADPVVGEAPEILLGNRLFDETRFAQFFAARAGGDVNAVLAAGDPVVQVAVTAAGTPLPGPFAGQSINCRVCHMDIEQKGVPGGGGRSYADFARRSPVPDRGDGETVTVRNAQALLNASLSRRNPFFLHFDGEFPTPEALVKTTLTGRNFGWLPEERAAAVAHIARVIREDDGRGAVAAGFGGSSYVGQFRGTDSLFPTNRPVPVSMAMDVTRASDEEVLDGVARFLVTYVRSLEGARDAGGAFAGSPYDQFLQKNGLPARPRARESDARYSRRLAKLIDRLRAPVFVTEADGRFLLHDQAWVFGAEELEGLRLFLRQPRGRRARPGTGNCVACHAAPTFTDFAFHNTGVAQEEYDRIHGAGSFAALDVPDMVARNADPAAWLPPSAAHPRARGPFRAVPAADRPGRTDLGLWNVYRNPAIDAAGHHQAVERMICTALAPRPCPKRNPARLLDAALALFKTPSLRDLSHSAPYFHDGSLDRFEDVAAFYRRQGDLARRKQVRNAAPALAGIALEPADDAPLAAFLGALNEDFE